jgi:hypothetical protein
MSGATKQDSFDCQDVIVRLSIVFNPDQSTKYALVITPIPV